MDANNVEPESVQDSNARVSLEECSTALDASIKDEPIVTHEHNSHGCHFKVESVLSSHLSGLRQGTVRLPKRKQDTTQHKDGSATSSDYESKVCRPAEVFGNVKTEAVFSERVRALEYVDVALQSIEALSNDASDSDPKCDPLGDHKPSTSVARELCYPVGTAHTCRICFELFADARLLANHMVAHYGIVRCETCGVTFQDSRKLNKHFDTHETGSFNCHLCWAVFTTRSAYDKHAHCAGLRCVKCNMTFPNGNQRSNHACKEVNVKGPYVCSVGKCRYEFTASQLYSDHLYAHCNVYRCVTCSLIFTDIYSLEAHSAKCSKESRTSSKVSGVTKVLPARETASKCSLRRSVGLSGTKGILTSRDKCILRSKVGLSGIKDTLTSNETSSKCALRSKVSLSNVSEILPSRETSNNCSLRCGNCDQFFGTRLLLNKHLEKNSKGSWTFLPCDDKLIDKNSYHIQTPCGVFRCGVCNKVFLEQSKFQKHLETHEKQPFRCPMCRKIFTNRVTLSCHIARAVCKKSYKCPFCVETFPTSKMMCDHKKKEHGRFNCPICRKDLSSGYLFETHIKSIHFGVRPFLCETCGKTYAANKDLQKHKEIHAVKSFVCSVCDKAFWYRPNLLKHISTHTTARPFRCDVCPATFRAHKSLVNHVIDHSRPDVACTICKKAFSKIVYLNKHTRRFHTSEKSFRCATCGQLFQSKNVLVVHLERQNCEKHVLCNKCERPFQTKSSLQKHLKAHVVCLRCSWCHKSFESKSHLSRHELLHSGDMPFRCKVCGKQYAQAGNFKYHMRTSHDVSLPFGCDECSEIFALPSLLKQHKLFHLLVGIQ